MAYYYGNNGFGLPMQGQFNGTPQQNGTIGNGMQPNQMNFGFPMMQVDPMMQNQMFMQQGFQQAPMMMTQPMNMTSGNQNGFFNQPNYTQTQPTLGSALEKKSVKQMMNEPLDDLLGSAIDSIAVNNTMPTYTNPTPVMNNMMAPQNNLFMQNGGGFNMTPQPMTQQPMNTTPQMSNTSTQSPAEIQDLASQFFASLGGLPNTNTNPMPVSQTTNPTPHTMTPVTPMIPTLTPTMPSTIPMMTPVNTQPSASGDDDDFFSSATPFQTTNPKPDSAPTTMPQHFNTNPQPSNTASPFGNMSTPSTSTNIQSVADQFFANLSGLPSTPTTNTPTPMNFNVPTTTPPTNAFNTISHTTPTTSPFAMPLQPEPPKPSPFSQAVVEPTQSNETSSGGHSRRGSIGSVPPSMFKLTTSTKVTPTHSVESSPFSTNDTSAVTRTSSKDKFEAFNVSNVLAAMNTPSPAPSAEPNTSHQGADSFFTELGKQQANTNNTLPTNNSPLQTSSFSTLAPQTPEPHTIPTTPVMLTSPVDIPIMTQPSLTPAHSITSLEDAFQAAITTPVVPAQDHSTTSTSIHGTPTPSPLETPEMSFGTFTSAANTSVTADHTNVASLSMQNTLPVTDSVTAVHTFDSKPAEQSPLPVNQPQIGSGSPHVGFTTPEHPHTPVSSGSLTPVTVAPQSDASMFKPHTPLTMLAQGSPQGSPFNTNDTSSTSSSQNLTPSVPAMPVANTSAESSLNIQALADSFFSSFQLPSVPGVPTPVAFGESVPLDVATPLGTLHVNGGESPNISLSTPLATAQVSLTPGSQDSPLSIPTVTPAVSLTPPTPAEIASATPVGANLFSIYESIKSQKKPQSDKPVQLEEMLNDSMNLLYQVMDAQNSKVDQVTPTPAPAVKTELTFDDEDMGDFVSAGTNPQPLPMGVGLTPVMLPLTPMFPPQMTPATVAPMTVEDWDFPTGPTMTDISIPSTNTSPPTQQAAPTTSTKGLQVTEDLFASIIGLKKSGESPRTAAPQSPSRTVPRDAPHPKRGTVVMGKIPTEPSKTQAPAPVSGKKVMQGIGPSSSTSKTTTATTTKQQATSTKQQPTKQQQTKTQPKAPLGTKSTPTISKTPTLPTRGVPAAKTAAATNGTKTTATKEAANSKRGSTIMGTIPGASNTGNLKSSAGADDFFGSFNGTSTPSNPPTAAAKKKGDSSLLMELPKGSESSQPPQKSLLDIFSSQAPIPLPESLNGSAEKKVQGSFGDEFEFSDFRTAKPDPITKSTFLAFYDPTAAKTEETPAEPVVEEAPKSSPSVPRVDLPFSSSSQLSAHLFFEAPKSTTASFSLGLETSEKPSTTEEPKVQVKQPTVTAGDVYKWQQSLEKASEEFNRAIEFLDNVNKQHEAAKELDILNKVMKTEKIKTYFAALNQIYTVISRILRTITQDTNKYNTMASPMAASLPFLVDQTPHKWKSLCEKAKSLGLDQIVVPGEKLSADDEQQAPNSERFCRLCMTRVNAYDARTCHWMQQDELYHLVYRCVSLGIVLLSLFMQKFRNIFSRRLKTPYESDNWNLRDLYLAIQLSEEVLPAMVVHKSNLVHNIGIIRSICEKYNKKLRLASKSVRVPGLMQLIAKELGTRFQGLMCYNLREACWLVKQYNFDDILMGYPTAEKAELFELFELGNKARNITLMIDSEEHVHMIDHAYDEWNNLYPDKQLTEKIKLCVDVDMSLRVFDCIHLGVHRSPIRSFRDFRSVADFITKYSKHCQLTGVMGYEAQVAGLPDKTPFVSKLFAVGIWAVKKLSIYMSARKRRLIDSYLQRENIKLEIFNGGGTGSLVSTSQEPWITEVTAGSGFLQSTLFDYYRTNKCLPAFAYALRVTRIPENDVVVCQSGGFVASGPTSPDKLPQTFLPRGLSTYPDEGFGEVQTPLKVNASVQLDIGDIVLLRPAKAGEIAERFNHYLVWDNKRIVERMDTYRGLNKTLF